MGWALRRVWTASALLGLLCAIAMIAVKVGLATTAPDTEPAFRSGQATAPPDKAFLTVALELLGSAVLVPFFETVLLFWLPRLALHRLKGAAGGPLFTALLGALGWGLHGADIHAIGHGLNFAMLGAWFWVVWAARGPGDAVFATTAAHGVWNGLLILAWVLWGRV